MYLTTIQKIKIKEERKAHGILDEDQSYEVNGKVRGVPGLRLSLK